MCPPDRVSVWVPLLCGNFTFRQCAIARKQKLTGGVIVTGFRGWCVPIIVPKRGVVIISMIGIRVRGQVKSRKVICCRKRSKFGINACIKVLVQEIMSRVCQFIMSIEKSIWRLDFKILEHDPIIPRKLTDGANVGGRAEDYHFQHLPSSQVD